MNLDCFLSLRRHSVRGKVSVLTCINLLLYMGRASRVHFVTYMPGFDSANPCPSVHSIISSGIDLKIAGLSHPKSISYTRTTNVSSEVRPTFLLKYLQDLKDDFDDNDIIVFSDMESALYATNSSHLESAFAKIERADTILFAAERSCWPGAGGCPEIPPEVDSSYKFPHSGGWIARHSVAVKFLAVWGEILMKQPQKSRHDQSALHQFLMRKVKVDVGVLVEVDYNCIIFQTLEPTREKWSKSNDDNPYMRPDGVLYNPDTDSEPHIYLFNGEKSFMAEAEKILWVAKAKSRVTMVNCKTSCISLFRNYPTLKTCGADPEFLQFVKSSCHGEHTQRKPRNMSSLYPTITPHFPVRTDPVDNLPVQRGRLDLLTPGIKHTMEQYQRLLQCSPVQPEIYGPGGAIHLMSFIPLTSETIMLTAAFIESNCELWDECRSKMKQFQNGEYSAGRPFRLSSFSSTRIFRVISGSLHWDWPWGKERLEEETPSDENYRRLFLHVLRFVSDAPESVFFAGNELHGLPPNLPVPHFSSSPPASRSSDIPAPWNSPFNFEKDRYSAGNYRTVSMVPEDNMHHGTGAYNKTVDDAYKAQFSKRLDKAAFFGTMTDKGLEDHAIARQVIMNIAYDHPEHLIANWSGCFSLTDINPASSKEGRTSTCEMNSTEWSSKYSRDKRVSEPFGHFDRSMQMKAERDTDLKEYMLSYKYLIIIGGISSADRLNTFLAHSGAVIMLQETDFHYHFTAFLKPWVHYVPLAFNGADVLEKVVWLKTHPKLAQRIAANGRNFGQSYLRLEDYYCYAATALEAMGTVATPSALVAFNATLVPDI